MPPMSFGRTQACPVRASHVEVADRLVTGQNPLSSKAVARAVLKLLRGNWIGAA